MFRRRGSIDVALLSWLLASFLTAACSHALIALAGTVFGMRSYGEHAHAAVAPVVLVALIVAISLLLRAALRTLDRSQSADDVALLGKRCGEMRPFVPSALVVAGSSITLLAMEFSEELSAFGHVEGVGDALGGNPAAGFAIIVAVAIVVTVVGLGSARVLLSTAAAAARALIVWIDATTNSPACEFIVTRAQRRRITWLQAFVARCFGMRAPPRSALA